MSANRRRAEPYRLLATDYCLLPNAYANPLILACRGANIAPNPSSTVSSELRPGAFSRASYNGFIHSRHFTVSNERWRLKMKSLVDVLLVIVALAALAFAIYEFYDFVTGHDTGFTRSLMMAII